MNKVIAIIAAIFVTSLLGSCYIYNHEPAEPVITIGSPGEKNQKQSEAPPAPVGPPAGAVGPPQ